MIYTDKTIKAMQIAYEQHIGQRDKGDVPYIFHPIHLAEQCSDETTTIVALLHDVVEDTDMTLEEIKFYGFSDEIIEALKLLTHKKGVPYLDYVIEISKNEIAKKVKILDLEHNLTEERLPSNKSTLSEKYLSKRQIYLKALGYLKYNIEL